LRSTARTARETGSRASRPRGRACNIPDTRRASSRLTGGSVRPQIRSSLLGFSIPSCGTGCGDRGVGCGPRRIVNHASVGSCRNPKGDRCRRSAGISGPRMVGSTRRHGDFSAPEGQVSGNIENHKQLPHGRCDGQTRIDSQIPVHNNPRGDGIFRGTKPVGRYERRDRC
jgi:hypothetical protein